MTKIQISNPYIKKALHQKNQKGFTLVELLIYMGILSVLVVVFTEIFISIIDTQLNATNTSNVAEDGRFIYSRFIYDVNRAESIIEPAQVGSSSASMTLSIDGENYYYELEDGDLLITSPLGSNSLNGYGSSISALLFTKVGTASAETVQINFTVDGTVNTRGIHDQQIFQTTAGLR